MSDLNMFHGKMPDFVSFPLFGFTKVIKLRIFYNIFDQKMMSDLNMSCQTVSDLV